MKRIILASQSPRRQQLLTAMGVDFETIPSRYDEHLDNSRSPDLVAVELALGKAMDVARDNPDAYVIGGDTIVTIDGHQLEKPTSVDDARAMLKRLAGRANYITTGVAIICLNDGVEITDADTMTIHFKPYDESKVEAYIATGDPMDKAGAYGIQHPKCAELIEKTEGRQDTGMGFPTHLIAKLLNRCEIGAHELTDEQIRGILA